jgi:internalin A
VLLVSPNFLASEFIAQHEFPPLMEAAQKEGLTIFWILVSSCMYEDCGIQHCQAAHDIAKPLDQFKQTDRNAVLTQICRKVRDAGRKIGAFIQGRTL